MRKELNCLNCSIGDFKQRLCDCHNGFCKEFKSIGTQEDLFKVVMQRIRPRGVWVEILDANEDGGLYIAGVYCSECRTTSSVEYNYCPDCGADMRGEE